ncbi:tail fiber assembly protein [Escherichia coli]|uniref:tail fiber assembly protein n=1 Tax=Escherichia coli TaxID=562 RepID=UPI000F86859E|nr:tail fiber assembly protein [Escherichia coli]
MSYFYSPSRNAFYNSELKSDYYDDLDAWPDDCIEVSDAVYQEFYLGYREGYKMVAGTDNQPSWEERPPLTHEEQMEQAEMMKQMRINEANNLINEKQWPSKLQLGRLNEMETTRFNAMLDYLELLENINVSDAPDIVWPLSPEV